MHVPSIAQSWPHYSPRVRTVLWNQLTTRQQQRLFCSIGDEDRRELVQVLEEEGALASFVDGVHDSVPGMSALMRVLDPTHPLWDRVF